MSKRRPKSTLALDRLATAERAPLLSELLLAHPELVDHAERGALDRLAVADTDEAAESIEWAIREDPGADVGEVHQGAATGTVGQQLRPER